MAQDQSQKPSRSYRRLAAWSTYLPIAVVVAGILAFVILFVQADQKSDQTVDLELSGQPADNAGNQTPAADPVSPRPAAVVSPEPVANVNPGNNSAPAVPVETIPADKTPAVTVQPAGIYTDYQNQSHFDQYQNRQRWLNFHASWCPQCRLLDQDIKTNNDQIPDNVVIFKVDYDSATELKRRYGVTIQTTIVAVDANGNKIKSYTAYSQPTLANLINELK